MEQDSGRRTCLRCGKIVRGRSDKKYCGDGCRNQYHNERTAMTNNCIRRITGILKRNRLILQSLADASDAHATVDRDTLRDRGFSFEYVTRIRLLEGITIRYCFDYCYRDHTEDCVVVSRDEH